MDFIKNMDIRNKLLLLLVMPILGLMFFSFFSINAKLTAANEMADVEQMIKMNVEISALVHELQKERGMTAGFLGSKGKKFSSELPTQRRLTDEKRANLDSFLTGFDQSILDSQLLSQTLNGLKNITSIRNTVSSLKISTKEAISFYTNLNDKFLATIGLVSKKSSNATIASMTVSYVNFLYGKERSGIERAVLSNVFSSNKFSEGMLEKAISLKAMQNTFFGRYKSSATPEQIQEFDALEKSDVSREVNKMRGIAYIAGLTASLDGFGVDASYWFKIATKRINALKKLEDQLSAVLSNTASSIRQQADTSLKWFTGMTVVALAITFILAILITWLLLNQLGGKPKTIANIAEQIAEGNLNIDFESSKKTRNLRGYS
jgi:methyl-accepting chemotaxis protein